MKFVQNGEDIRWFEGRMCLRGKPVEVEDAYGVSAFKSNPAFEEVFEETKDEKEVKETAAPPVLDYQACPKCGRVVKRGRFIHIKYCKGKN